MTTETTKALISAIADNSNTQRDIAKKYQAAFYTIPDIDWHKINIAIAKRWPSKSGLTRVKEMAWKIYEENKS
jgi:hypothetical protein